MRNRLVKSSLFVGAVGLAMFGAGAIANALSAVDRVILLLPASGNQPEPDSGPATDKLVVTGGRVTTTDGAGCQAGTFPVQNSVLVDPAAGRSSRIVGIIALQADPIPPGTRLTTLTREGSCTISGTSYVKYNGTVE